MVAFRTASQFDIHGRLIKEGEPKSRPRASGALRFSPPRNDEAAPKKAVSSDVEDSRSFGGGGKKGAEARLVRTRKEKRSP